MDLSRFARRRYTEHATPIEPLPRFSAALAAHCPGGRGPEVWVKRDDLLGLFPGGNKTRKLEFLMADALAQGADTLVTCGAPQSNHCRITLAAAVKEGLQCRFVIEERVPGSYSASAGGNNLMFRPARRAGGDGGAGAHRHGGGHAAGGRRRGRRRRQGLRHSWWRLECARRPGLRGLRDGAAALRAESQCALALRLQFSVGRPAHRVPALQMAQRQVAQRDDPLVPVVQTGDVVELLAAGLGEGLARFLVDLLQRFQTVGDETRADQIDALDALARELLQRRFGVGLQPLGLAETALEGDAKVVLRQARARCASSRAVFWQAQWYGSPSCSVRSGTPWKLITSTPARPSRCQWSRTWAASASM